jgi:hypothetical protein
MVLRAESSIDGGAIASPAARFVSRELRSSPAGADDMAPAVRAGTAPLISLRAFPRMVLL